MRAYVDYISEFAYYEFIVITSAELAICELNPIIDKGRNLPEDTSERLQLIRLSSVTSKR